MCNYLLLELEYDAQNGVLLAVQCDSAYRSMQVVYLVSERFSFQFSFLIIINLLYRI